LIGPSQTKRKKEVKTMEAPQNRKFYGKMESAQREGLWAKHMGLKQGATRNILREHIGNLENIVRI
jgi:hypothetical protein